MSVLYLKLARDLYRLRGQALSIALVMASGIAVIVMSFTTLESLVEMSSVYYERQRFGDIFAHVEKAPNRLVARIGRIPGVQTVQTRIVKLATLDVRKFEEPVIGKFVSIPEIHSPLLNELVIRQGRYISPGRVNEIILSEPFAEAHEIEPGDKIAAILNGHKRTLDVVGIALSPEYIYAIAPGGLMPDDKRFGIVWMGRTALAAAYNLDGAFNDISLSLLEDSHSPTVLKKLDEITAPYGGGGAIAREDQLSNWFLMNEIEQLRTVGLLLPGIFLAVAAFLTQMVLSRLITTERGEIGLLKAFGYTRLRVAGHYALLVMAISSMGIVLGCLAGSWLGRHNTQVYAEFYRFPFFYYSPSVYTYFLSGIISLLAALAGGMQAVYRAATLPPAEAMRPPAPPAYKQQSALFTKGISWLDQPSRIIIRQIVRWPLRSALTSLGVAFSIGVLVMALQWIDSIESLIDTVFFDAQRQDITISLNQVRGDEVINDLRHLPGVLAVEPARLVAVKFRVGDRTHRGSIQGVLSSARLNPIYDVLAGVRTPSSGGLSIANMLAKKLNVTKGDMIRVRILEGRREEILLPVVDIFESYIGMTAFMELSALNAVMKEGHAVEYLNLLVDEREQAKLIRELKQTPFISAVTLRKAAVNTFNETMADTLLIFIGFFVIFACILAFGLAYNSTRIALSERARELATLRVLGFTKPEISYILLGEVALLIVLSLPLGVIIGWALAWLMSSAFETELFRVPLVIHPTTYGKAILVTLSAAVVSALVVRKQVDNLDLIKVLKTRE